ncbi:unnamed protein product [Acanthoscelides obtectus]|uniref:Uncharacterized protein n=1 Tax=Acanthoscelides obtectus TaxID=200917 RepID=A0A9P0LE81_ACAOB|nr:unnamed protein product [Acanthoscelides obtectus]CAK1621053.1 Zinc finger BED domain-containing protein 6 [Acanthoscelides obtectus]
MIDVVTALNCSFIFNNNSFSITGIYRPNPTNVQEFVNNLDSYLRSTANCDISLLVGNINIDLLREHEYSNLRYVNMLQQNGYISQINTPTRVDSNSSTIIDYIFLKANRFKVSETATECKPILLENCMTDHYPVLFNFGYLKGSGATCNLRKHLKAKHFAVITQDLPSPSSLRTSAELEEIPGPSTSSTPWKSEVTPGSSAYDTTKEIDNGKRRMPFPSSKQSKISTFATRPMYIPRTKNRHIKVLNMIIKDMQPFTIVEDERFRELLEEFDPAYKLPSRKTLSNSLLPQTYDEVVQKVKNLQKNSEYLTITTDTWTSTAVENYFGHNRTLFFCHSLSTLQYV